MATSEEEHCFNKKNRSPFDITQGERQAPWRSNLENRGYFAIVSNGNILHALLIKKEVILLS